MVIFIYIANSKNGVNLSEFNHTQQEILYKRDEDFYVNDIEE